MRAILKFFTLDQANKMLPLVDSIAIDVTNTWEEIMKGRTDLDRFDNCQKKAGSLSESDKEKMSEVRSDVNALVDRINAYIKELEALGIYVESYRCCILDFPALYRGRKIQLCYTPSMTKEILFWHELDEMENDRQPITEEMRGALKSIDYVDL